ncbi:MAG: hypothetical protein Roseis2KO_33660 [Roseivirga sp.]
MSKVRVIILEDEVLVARDLGNRLRHLGYEIAGTFHSYDDARSYLAEGPDFDLMLIDIELDGVLSGIDIARELQQKGERPFIFLTSHAEPEIVKEAQSTGPSAYLIKPFRDREVQIAIDLAVSNFALKEAPEVNEEDSDAYLINDSFFIKKKFRYDKVKVEDILFAEAQRNYTLIKTKVESYLLSLTLKTVINRLKYPYFVQSHRSYLLNMKHITGFEGNRVYIGENEIPVSKNFREAVFNRFRTL